MCIVYWLVHLNCGWRCDKDDFWRRATAAEWYDIVVLNEVLNSLNLNHDKAGHRSPRQVSINWLTSEWVIYKPSVTHLPSSVVKECSKTKKEKTKLQDIFSNGHPGLDTSHEVRVTWKRVFGWEGGLIKCLFQSYKNIYLTGFNQCTIAQIRIKLTVYDDDIEICSKWQVSNKKPEAYLASGSKSLFSNRKTGLDHISLTIEFYINIYIIICIQRVCCFQFTMTRVWPIIKKVTHVIWIWPNRLETTRPYKKGQRLWWSWIVEAKLF